MPSVSVIIPTYKHRDYVLTALESVFKQTFTDYEVIVVNDGSPDDTVELLRPFVSSGKIKYIEQMNRGQASARNRGIAEATGEFVALLDDDDLWLPDKLTWQVEYLRQHPQIDAVVGGVRFISHDTTTCIKELRSNDHVTFETLFEGNPIVSPGQALIRTSRLRQVGGFDKRVWGADDFDLWFKLSRTGHLQIVDRLSLLYRVHGGNASNDILRMFANCRLVLESHLKSAESNAQCRLRRAAYRWLYASSLGRAMMDGLRCGIRRGDFHEIVQRSSALLSMLICCELDHVVLRWLVKDFAPRLTSRAKRFTELPSF